ncbi:TlpA family protein disulfide reductase [Algibacter pacificus]|uniref:TlpA family protein disulfide reductase n=1 Tax=Algibacter pacificus TaxID=2599389 RepID=UPI0011C75823|nr:TlpA disulfide reductase family protein [Algibacter pacificus]
MKIYILAVLALAILACESKPKNYVTLTGNVLNSNPTKTITILNREGYKKEIKVNADGTFSDTLNVKEGQYMFTDGNEYANIYLKNNNTTTLNFDADKFNETLIFSGNDADKNNFYIENIRLQEQYLTEDLMSKSEEDFDKAFTDLKTAYTELKSTKTGLDDAFFQTIDTEFENMYKVYKRYHNEKHALLKILPKGSPSPDFKDYENYNGGSTSLSDLKGKYTYFDIWATWCGPCKVEIPHLKALEKQYHGKNIQFVSISVDDAGRSGSFEKAKLDWKQMIADKNMGGIQLFSDSGWRSDFIQAYQIKGIPRFILIDPNGDIISPDAPRPSNPELIKLFNSLNI